MKNLLGFNRSLLSIFLSVAIQFGAAQSFAGGGGTGGGNSLGSVSVSQEEIKQYIKKSKLPLLYILRGIEFSLSMATGGYTTNSDPRSVQLLTTVERKIFKGEKTIYQSLKEADVDSILNQPCFNSEGLEVEASVEHFPKLCFNLKKLAARLNGDSIQNELLALMVHELSHTAKIHLSDKIGATEQEATTLQFMVKGSLTNDIYRKVPGLISNFKSKLEDTLSTASISENSFKLQPQATCALITLTMAQTNDLLQRGMNIMGEAGISYSSPEQLWATLGVVLKASNLMTFCSQTPSFDQMNQAFNGQDMMSLENFRKILSPGQNHPMPLPKISIRRVGPGNAQNAYLEMQDIKLLLTEVLNKI